ncbi:alpha/beta hydrolase [Zhihengliuella flava]|uniref:Pimeloyl-ACP methyl ester carboxylesterase n=1 Tax=Zhihengliuella flava TaxID=1285193 RepID=A0A931DA09_9MICC|nr:alpha/beta hydrolase [Zhihengliuella flava]MBG6085192.1 pimeloyl-ACP methyl ester carboxylesterase [Zhihengliuella flava]
MTSPRTHRWSRLLRAAAATLAVTALLAACTEAEPAQEETYSAPVPDALERYYEQTAQWEPCEEDFECATVVVPLNYADPGSESIEIALMRHQALMPRGSLFVNPGGPGASGIDLLRNAATSTFSPELREKYHLIGFDPRGVGDSEPIQCRTPAQLDASRAGNTLSMEELGALCAEKNGEALAHVDTESAARDLDILRAAVGEERLDYLGFSYGTKLGAAYSDLFGENVDRMVLDGAMNPALGLSQVTTGQAQRFEQSLRTWVEWCDGVRDCPVSGGADAGLAQLNRYMDELAAEPLQTQDGREFNDRELANALLLPLYEDAWWDTLVVALQELEQGDPERLMQMADARSGRAADGTYLDNSWDAFTAINCLDYSDPTVDGAELDRLLSDISPTLGWYLGGELACTGWPAEPTGTEDPAEPLNANSRALVVGTTGDPATPYEWSQALADQLAGEDPSNVSLLTYDGEGHTAYGRSNDCVTQAVDAFLLDGEFPASDATC